MKSVKEEGGMFLEEVVEKTELVKSILVRELRNGDEIKVEAGGEILKIRIIDSRKRTVMVESFFETGFFRKPIFCTLNGSTLGGSAIWHGFIAYGWHIEFWKKQTILQWIKSLKWICGLAQLDPEGRKIKLTKKEIWRQIPAVFLIWRKRFGAGYTITSQPVEVIFINQFLF